MNYKLAAYLKPFLRAKATERVVSFVMLCGKQVKKGAIDNRYLTRKLLSDKRKDVIVIYSEELFHIIENEEEMDLLKFEELLVEISDGVIVFLESMGTAAELGAFTYLDELAKRTLVFIDSKYEKDDSFINGGPVKRIRHFSGKENICDVVFTKFLSNENVDFGNPTVFRKIINFTNFKQPSFRKENFDYKGNVCVISPSLLVYLVIDLIFVFDYIPKETLFEYLHYILGKDTNVFEIKLNSQNKFNNDSVKKYLVEMLIKWGIISEVSSKKTSDILLSINYDTFNSFTISTLFLGKTLFTKKTFEGREYLLLKYKNRKYVKSKFGDLYEVNNV